MKNNKKYFLLLLKKGIPFTIFNFVVFSLLYILPLAFTTNFRFEENVMGNYNRYYNLSTNFGFLVAALAIYAFIIPIKTFGFLTNKKYIDTHYSVPIERKTVAFTKIISDILCVIIPFTLVYFIGSLITLLFYNEVLYIYYIIFYLILIVSFILYFMYNAFFFTRANKIIDGVVTVIFANFVFILLMASIVEGFDIKTYKVIELLNIKGRELNYLSLPFMPFIKYGNYFNEMIISKYDYHDYLFSFSHYNDAFGEKILSYSEWMIENRTAFNPIYLIFLAIISVIAIILFIILFNKRKPEEAEEIGTSYFGLKTLSPICFSLLTILFSIESDLFTSWVTFIIVIIPYLGTTLLELRTLKFPLYKILILAGMFTLTFISLFG